MQINISQSKIIPFLFYIKKKQQQIPSRLIGRLDHFENNKIISAFTDGNSLNRIQGEQHLLLWYSCSLLTSLNIHLKEVNKNIRTTPKANHNLRPLANLV